ncbi:hypothetical protein [Mesorhizobium sp.]|uniref:hypothetical protein n=1 Tax=Mesorhizobium sp. TaxID=1871066 RepID=UPI000FE6F6FD|nr:hypothetical protein [Mesorhizobium sp.]RWL09255.1 MAG: hypothetical protein EOR56_23635 [Mesorhizobium sp.]
MTAIKPKPPYEGAPVGILMFERARDAFYRPLVPGSVGNASTWTVPARYMTMPGINFSRIIGPEAVQAEAVVVQAATELVRQGAQLITSNCGFMIRYQDAVRAAVDVPVLLSSLVLGPFLERVLPQGKALGIVTASASALTPDLLNIAGLPSNSERVAIAGLEDCPVFAGAWLTMSRDFDYDAVEKETVDAAVNLVEKRPDIGMLLLECSELPPFAAAVQRATHLPVYDFTSMIEFFAQGLIRRPFSGFN